MGIVLDQQSAGCTVGSAVPPSQYGSSPMAPPIDEGVSSILPRIYAKVNSLCDLGEVLRNSVDPSPNKTGCGGTQAESGPIGVVQALYRVESALEYLGDHLQFIHHRLNN